MDRLRIARAGPGHPRTRPGRLLGDKAYSSKKIRAHLRRRRITATIPEPADQIAHRAFGAIEDVDPAGLAGFRDTFAELALIDLVEQHLVGGGGAESGVSIAADVAGHVQHAGPLFFVERNRKAAQAIHRDPALLAHLEGHLPAGGFLQRFIFGAQAFQLALELADAEAARTLGLGSTGAALLMGVDGIREQVEWQCAEAQRLMASLGCRESRVLDSAERDQMWKTLGELGRTGAEDVAAVMSWGVLPTHLARAMDEGRAIATGHGLRATLAAHAGVGIATAVLAGGDASAVVATLTEWRALVNGLGGHAVLQWAPLGVKERVAVWDAAGPDLRIMKGIKERLDPLGILNPGRFVGGI